jgi:hypothetical protein
VGPSAFIPTSRNLGPSNESRLPIPISQNRELSPVPASNWVFPRWAGFASSPSPPTRCCVGVRAESAYVAGEGEDIAVVIYMASVVVEMTRERG